MTHEDYQWIAEAAYYKALARGFAPGHDQDDWLEAKKEYENIILQRRNGLVVLVQN
jgi:hypothetical protein